MDWRRFVLPGAMVLAWCSAFVVCAAPAASCAQLPLQAADQAARLVEPNERAANAIQPPEVVMDLAGIRPGLVIGEVGAGDGRVTVHLATRVGPSGKIYANDIDRRALDSLARRVARLGLSNVEILLGAVDDTRFPEGALDMVIMVWVFHHVEQPVPLLKSALRSLKPSGVIVMVEPLPKHSEPGARRLTRELVVEEAGAAGLRLDSMIEGKLREDNVFILRAASQEGGKRGDPPTLSTELKILELLVSEHWVGEATSPDGNRRLIR